MGMADLLLGHVEGARRGALLGPHVDHRLDALALDHGACRGTPRPNVEGHIITINDNVIVTRGSLSSERKGQVLQKATAIVPRATTGLLKRGTSCAALSCRTLAQQQVGLGLRHGSVDQQAQQREPAAPVQYSAVPRSDGIVTIAADGSAGSRRTYCLNV